MSNNVSQFSEIHTPSSYPASEKRYVDGSRAGLRVPYREISLWARPQPSCNPLSRRSR
jgi:hypothetical protein